MDKLLGAWLGRQCNMISGMVSAVIFTFPPADKTVLGAYIAWPEPDTQTSDLKAIGHAACQSEKSVVQSHIHHHTDTGDPMDAVAVPLFFNDVLWGVAAFGITSRSKALQQTVVKQIQIGCQWLETMKEQAQMAGRDQMSQLMGLIAAALEPDTFTKAAEQVVDEIAGKFACKRVMFGVVRFNRIRLEAASSRSDIDHRRDLIRAAGEAMEEAVDRKTTMTHPAPEATPQASGHFHCALSHLQHQACICTIPLGKNGRVFGALLLERDADQPFNRKTITLLEQTAMMLGPVLESRYKSHRPLISKISEGISKGLMGLFGPRHLLVKLMVTALAVLTIWLSTTDSLFRITCEATVKADTSRIIAAPQQGFISQAHIRSGDRIRTGDILAELDRDEFLLQRDKWQTRKRQFEKKLRKALAESDRAEIAILTSQRDQADAELKLVAHQLNRTRIFAPFSGMVIKGDLSQSLGAPVNTGDVLFEIAPVKEFKVSLRAKESDIRFIQSGQEGVLKLTGLPHRPIAFRINRVSRVAVTQDNSHFFQVEATMENSPDLIQPGMEGVGKIRIHRAKRIWILTRKLVDWARFSLWAMLPWEGE